MFDHWRKAAKNDTNIGSNGDGSSLEVPRTTDLTRYLNTTDKLEMMLKVELIHHNLL